MQEHHNNQQQTHYDVREQEEIVHKRTTSLKSSIFSDAPPINKPPTEPIAAILAALEGLTLPPYNTLLDAHGQRPPTESAHAFDQYLNHWNQTRPYRPKWFVSNYKRIVLFWQVF